MELIRGLHNLKARHRGCVATIGNFDGVHLGHQAIIAQLARKAGELRLPATVVLFEPQPREHFQGNGPVPARLMRLREKLQALRRQPVERVLCLRFDETLAALAPEAFIQRILVDGLGVKYLVVGDDFRFGARRAGDFALLRRAGAAHGFEVAPMHTFAIDGERVSSTRVREALARDDLATAAKLLGRPYRICGRVAHGDKLGRTLGVPTANLNLHRLVTPLHGIYVVEVFGLNQAAVAGVASVGSRPAVGGTRTLLEVHLFDFSREIYGHTVQVDFLHKLRDERHFDSLDELKLAMQADIRQARAWFVQHQHGGTIGHAASHS
jgi:riboflavin kinase/FMN adenylyltransferase